MVSKRSLRQRDPWTVSLGIPLDTYRHISVNAAVFDGQSVAKDAHGVLSRTSRRDFQDCLRSEKGVFLR